MSMKVITYRNETMGGTVFQASVQFIYEHVVPDDELVAAGSEYWKLAEATERLVKTELTQAMSDWMDDHEDDGYDNRPMFGPPKPVDLMNPMERLGETMRLSLFPPLEEMVYSNAPITFNFIRSRQ